MIKKIKIISLIILLSIVLFGCSTNNGQTQQTYQPQEQMFYKTIDVRVAEIRITWKDPRLTKWAITVKSEEYGLENTLEQFCSPGGNSSYGLELYQGQIKEGTSLKAELLTWKTGETINRRYINQLVR